MKDKLKCIQSKLIDLAYQQMESPECVDAKELGEVVDIIKDIDEAIYYCTVVKAMEDGHDVGAITVNTATHGAMDTTDHNNRIDVVNM